MGEKIETEEEKTSHDIGNEKLEEVKKTKKEGESKLKKKPNKNEPTGESKIGEINLEKNKDKKSGKKGKKEDISDKKKNHVLAKKGKRVNKNETLKSKIEKKNQLLKKKVLSSKTEKATNNKGDSSKINSDSKDDHIFKVPSLESFRSQKNKSTKLLSPPIPKMDEAKEKASDESGFESEKENNDENDMAEIEKLKLIATNKNISVKLKSIVTSEEIKNESAFDKLFDSPPRNIESPTGLPGKEVVEDDKTSDKLASGTKRKTRLSDGDEISSDAGEDTRDEAHYESDSDENVTGNHKDDTVIKKKHTRSSELSDTEEVEDVFKKNKKLVKTRKTRNTEESSDDDLSPTRQSKPKSKLGTSTNKIEKAELESDNTPSTDADEKIGQKRKTRSQSLTSESESDPDEDKPPKKSSPRSKVFKQCENSQGNKENSEKENSGRNIKKSRNSESENDSDEGCQKRKTRQQKNKEESDKKESGSDKENELLMSPKDKKENTNAIETEDDKSQDNENDDEKKNTRRNSKRVFPGNETTMESMKTNEPKTDIKQEIESDKKYETTMTRKKRPRKRKMIRS